MKNIFAIIFIGYASSVIIKVDPYLQDASAHSMTIMWETDSNDQKKQYHKNQEQAGEYGHAAFIQILLKPVS